MLLLYPGRRTTGDLCRLYDWWAKRTGQESPEVIEVAVDVKLCLEIGKETK